MSLNSERGIYFAKFVGQLGKRGGGIKIIDLREDQIADG